ncbi:hypothetical protein G9A89_016143 [Geosiphon pyriformis]|nr:hypothetical protein G9A89_016143 [Geosiphon pyriformis]
MSLTKALAVKNKIKPPWVSNLPQERKHLTLVKTIMHPVPISQAKINHNMIDTIIVNTSKKSDEMITHFNSN